MIIWHDMKKPPRKSKENFLLSETVLIYDGNYHNFGFYDFKHKAWYSTIAAVYVEDYTGKWTYLPKPFKIRKLKIKFWFE